MPQAIPVVVAWWGSTAAVVAGYAVTWGTIVKGVLLAATVAYSSSQQRKMKKRMADLKSQGRTLMIREPAASRPVIYGTQRAGGVMVFAHTAGTNNEFLHLIIVLAGHEVSAIGDVYLGEEIVPLIGTSAIGKYAGFVRVKKYLGTDDQTVGTGSLASEAPAFWTANHRLRGIACLEVRLKWDADKFPTGLPNISAVVQGKKLYDPRTATTVFSSNPPLVLRDYLTSVEYGLGITDTELDDDTIIAAANICDEDVTLGAGGMEPRYTCNGIVDTSVSPAEAIEDILTSMAGWAIFTAGKWRVHAGAHQSTAASFTIDDLRGPISVQTSTSQRDTANAVKAVFVSPTNQWQPADLPPIRNGTYEVEDGSVSRTFTADATTDVLTLDSAANLVTATALKFTTSDTAPGGLAAGTVYYWIPVSSTSGKLATSRADAIAGTAIDITSAGSGTHTARFGEVIWQDIDLPFTTSASTGQRLAKIQLERERQDITVSLPLKLCGLKVQAGDVVALTIERYGWNSKLFEVIDWRFAVQDQGGAPALGVDLTLRETASGVWDWNSGEETTVDLAPNTTLPDPWTSAPPTSVALSNNLVVQADGTVRPELRVTWTAPTDQFVVSGGHMEIQFSLAGTGAWIDAGTSPGNQGAFILPGIVIGTEYDARVRSVNTLGAHSAWVHAAETVVAIGDATAPGVPSNLSAVGQAEAIFLSWTVPGDSDFSHVGIYETAGGAAAPGDSTSPTFVRRADSYVRGGLAADTVKDYYVRSFDTSGNKSAWVGPAQATALAAPQGDPGPQGPQGDQGAQGDTGPQGNPGPGLVFRGEYDSGGTYFHTSKRRDVVRHLSIYYLTSNESKSGLSTWGTPGVADWEEFGAQFSSVATALLLAEDATITQLLTFPSGGEIRIGDNSGNNVRLSNRRIAFYSGDSLVSTIDSDIADLGFPVKVRGVGTDTQVTGAGILIKDLQVVGERQPAIADVPTGYDGADTVDAVKVATLSVRVAEIIAMLRAWGAIST